MFNRSTKRIATYGKGKRYEKPSDYNVFDTERFFTGKKLRLVETIATKPLRLIVAIEEDKTEYVPYDNGDVADNTGKLLEVRLDSRSAVEAGKLLQAGNAYVDFKYESSYCKVVSYSKLTVMAKTIILIDSEQSNLREIYSIE